MYEGEGLGRSQAGEALLQQLGLEILFVPWLFSNEVRSLR